jgi:hypothetical protein
MEVFTYDDFDGTANAAGLGHFTAEDVHLAETSSIGYAERLDSCHVCWYGLMRAGCIQ